MRRMPKDAALARQHVDRIKTDVGRHWVGDAARPCGNHGPPAPHSSSHAPPWPRLDAWLDATDHRVTDSHER